MFFLNRYGVRSDASAAPRCAVATPLRRRAGVRTRGDRAPRLQRATKTTLSFLALFLCVALSASAAEPVWNAFAGRESVLVRGLPGVAAGAAVWFSVTKDQRVVNSGTVRADAQGALALPVRLPEMKPGVALALEVTLRLGDDHGRPLRAGTLWAFAERPFEPGHNPVAPRKILLYDPDEKTAAAFRAIDLPFEAVARLDALAGSTNAMIIVAEGLSLDAERGLWQVLSDAVARGNRVLLLAPRDGRLQPPATWRKLVAGDAQEVLRHGSVAGLPYKLDLASWPPDGRAVSTRFRLVGYRDEAVFDVTPDAGSVAVGWDDATSGGCFRACGLGIIAKWNETPAARWLLVEMLERGE